MAMMHWGCWDVDTAVCWGQSQDLTSVLLGHLKKNRRHEDLLFDKPNPALGVSADLIPGCISTVIHLLSPSFLFYMTLYCFLITVISSLWLHLAGMMERL